MSWNDEDDKVVPAPADGMSTGEEVVDKPADMSVEDHEDMAAPVAPAEDTEKDDEAEMPTTSVTEEHPTSGT